MGEVCGWQLPLHYGDAGAEERAAGADVGLVDRSLLGKAVVTGRDRASFLQGMLTNDIKALKPGQGCPAAFLDAHGKVMALLDVYALEDRLLLALPPGFTEKTIQLFDKYLISEKASFEAADDAWVVPTVVGPRAGEVLARAAGREIALEPHQHAEAEMGGRRCGSSRAGARGFRRWVAGRHPSTARRCGPPCERRARARWGRRPTTCSASRPACPGTATTSTNRSFSRRRVSRRS